MGQILLLLFAVAIIYILIKKLGPKILILLVSFIFGLQALLAALCTVIVQKIKWKTPFILALSGALLYTSDLVWTEEIDTLYEWHSIGVSKYFFLTVITLFLIYPDYLLNKKLKLAVKDEAFKEQEFGFTFLMFFGTLLGLSSVLVYTEEFVYLMDFLGDFANTVCLVISLILWFSSVLSIFIAYYLIYQLNRHVVALHQELDTNGRLELNSFITNQVEKSLFDSKTLEKVYASTLSQPLFNGEVSFYELMNERWILTQKWLTARKQQLHSFLISSKFIEKEKLTSTIAQILEFNTNQAQDFAERYLTEEGQFLSFSNDEENFVHFNNFHFVRICRCCGHTEEIEEGNEHETNTEWYCSDICEQTEKTCLEITKSPMEKFLTEASQNSLILVTIPEAWKENHKIASYTSTTGHGFAAENGNHIIDKIYGHDAKIIGGDNAKNGADRLVDGAFIQTKYCKTAARSVGAGFDGQNGSYRYYDKSGKPMQLEVPKDQYEQAIQTMRNKIKEGKVPGVENPDDASKLIRKGHLTYEQACNITKFGTFESISYDIAQGTVVAATSGGISFAITASIHLYKTGDAKKALEAALLQAGKSFGTTLTVFVAAQQLQRIAFVQQAVGTINIGNMSSSLGDFISRGLGASNKTAANRLLQGTVVTSIVLIAVSSGPDALKLARGRISKAQFIKNLSVTTASVTGGVVGSIAGGSVGAAIGGPVGLYVGKITGGFIGGAVASVTANKFASSFMTEDREIILKIITRQMEYLIKLFYLTEHEIENLNTNLQNVLNQQTLEMIFASENRKVTANMILKPLVVSIIKQRPTTTLDLRDINLIEDHNTVVA